MSWQLDFMPLHICIGIGIQWKWQVEADLVQKSKLITYLLSMEWNDLLSLNPQPHKTRAYMSMTLVVSLCTNKKLNPSQRLTLTQLVIWFENIFNLQMHFSIQNQKSELKWWERAFSLSPKSINSLSVRGERWERGRWKNKLSLLFLYSSMYI